MYIQTNKNNQTPTPTQIIHNKTTRQNKTNTKHIQTQPKTTQTKQNKHKQQQQQTQCDTTHTQHKHNAKQKRQ